MSSDSPTLETRVTMLETENERLTKEAKWLNSPLFVQTICTLYESGVGYGLKEDGVNYKADFNPCREDDPAYRAYELGKQQGREMKNEKTVSDLASEEQNSHPEERIQSIERQLETFAQQTGHTFFATRLACKMAETDIPFLLTMAKRTLAAEHAEKEIQKAMESQVDTNVKLGLMGIANTKEKKTLQEEINRLISGDVPEKNADLLTRGYLFCEICGRKRLKNTFCENGCSDRFATPFAYFENNSDEAVNGSALAAISEIRDTWVSRQNINWSGDIYPLVAILNAALGEGLPNAKRKAIEDAIGEHRKYWMQTKANDPKEIVHE